jgi:hypothetical protein
VTIASVDGMIEELCLQLRSGTPTQLEAVTVDLLSDFMALPFFLARGGFQHGADGGTAGQQDRNIRVECKRYSDTTRLDDRELRGEIDDALARNPDLEAWILVATRSVDETTREKLHIKAEETGLPIIVIDWTSVGAGIPDFGSLCAYSPQIVGRAYGQEAERLASALAQVASQQWDRLRQSIQQACIGLTWIKQTADRNIEAIWKSEAEAKAQFSQNIAQGTCSDCIERISISSALQAWYDQPGRDPAIVVGDEGVGKTWATFQWVHNTLSRLPPTLLIPSASFCEIRDLSPAGIHDFIARELRHLAGVRSDTFWSRRLTRILKHCPPGSTQLLIIVDGLNQTPSFDWLRLLQILQSDSFGPVRVIASTQRNFFVQELNQLRRLAYPAKTINVEPYDITPGGEFDQILQMNGMVRSDISDDILALARNPRMFPLVIRFRDQVTIQGDITPLRLLWAYGRDELGHRAGRAFVDTEWEEWLLTLAKTYSTSNDGSISNSAMSITELSQAVSQQHRTPSENQRRLKEIIDGTWMEAIPGMPTKYRPRAETIALALGLGIVERLRMVSDQDVAAELSSFLDPIRAASSTADALAAALAIAVSAAMREPVVTAVASELLQGQNSAEKHLQEVVATAPAISTSILNCMERSTARAHAAARQWILKAIRRIPQENQGAWSEVLARLGEWLAVTECPSKSERAKNDEAGQYVSKRLIEDVGTDQPGSVVVLGIRVAIRPYHEPYLGGYVALVLQERRLDGAITVFKAAAVAQALSPARSDTWASLKWLLLFDSMTRQLALSTLTQMAESVLALDPENNVRPDLKARVAALLLWLPDDPDMDAKARATNPPDRQFYSYQVDYLADPAASLFQVERRHLDLVLHDERIDALEKCRKLKKLLPDPDFVVPPSIVSDVGVALSDFDIERLSIGRFYTLEEHQFEEIMPVGARFVPKDLADLCRRRIRELGKRTGEALYWNCIKAPEYLLVAGESELQAVRDAKSRYDHKSVNESDEKVARAHLLQLEIPFLTPYDQLCAMAEDERAWILLRQMNCTDACSPEEIDRFIMERGAIDGRATEAVFNHLAQHAVDISEQAFDILFPLSQGQDEDENSHRVIGFMALANSAPDRFGQRLLASGWRIQPDQSHLEMDSGSAAILAASKSVALDEFRGRLAPWCLLREACSRGDAHSLEAAAAEVSRALGTAYWPEEPSPVEIIIDATDRHLRVSFDERDGDSEADPEKVFDDTHQRARWTQVNERGRAHIQQMHNQGALLFKMAFSAKDVRPLVERHPDIVDSWLAGMDTQSIEFRARVNRAGGLFLALCEVLLGSDPERGAILWRYLEQKMPIRIAGLADIQECIHVLFRVPASAAVDALRDEFFSIRRNTSEKAYLDIVVVASINGATDWLNRKVAEDEASGCAWRGMRATMLRGMIDRPEIEKLKWPNGVDHDDVTRSAMLSRNMHAIAHYWWKKYISESSLDNAFAAWVLFLETVDRRCWIWLHSTVDRYRGENDPAAWRLKMCHFEANRSQLNSAIRDREEKGTHAMSKYLWGNKSPADLLDMSIVNDRACK